MQLQSKNPQSNGHQNGRSVEDEVEAALDELEITLEGTNIGKQTDITSVPELSDYLRYMK